MPYSSEWSLVICGGGSGGHLFPALAVIEELQHQRRAPQQIVFLSADRSIDEQILSRYGIEYVALPAMNFHQLRRHPWQALYKLFKSVREASKILKSLPAPILLGTGGFSSVPGGLAGRWRKRPLLLLEQNVIPGRATMFLSRFAQLICASFSETRQWIPDQIRCEVIGNPVRSRIANLIHNTEPPREKCLLILGGSQGAFSVNDALSRLINRQPETFQDWTFLHQTGVTECEKVREVYRQAGLRAEVSPFFENMTELYQRASIVISRAGGTSLAEIACADLPAILIPFPKSMRNHQQINARHFVGKGAAIMIEEGKVETFDSELDAAVTALITNAGLREQMSAAMRSCARPNAAQLAADLICQIAEKNAR